MSFLFRNTLLKGLVIIEPQFLQDERGFFVEIYKESEFFAAGISERFVQDNYSISKRGVLRGLHFQKGLKSQGKLIRATRGRIWDVAVDLRSNSSTFGKWYSLEISEENRLMLYIPPSFAHGFLSMSDVAEVSYKCTSEYDAANDGGIRWNDPGLAIDWPIRDVIVSLKDASLPFLKDLI